MTISADAVHIHNDGTLEVKVPNAQKVGRVLVMDTDSHIGGGLFYPDDAVQGEWQPSSIKSDMWHCSVCGSPLMTDDINETHFCPNCGARMKGGDAKMETEPPKPVHPLYMQQSRHDDGRMTKEEAKEILTHNWTRVDNPNYSESELDEAFFMAIEALSAEEAVWKEYEAEFTDLPDIPRYYYEKVVGKMAHEINMLKEQLESADAEWIPCSERLPSDDEIVNITWVNHNPPPYYADIREKPFVASGLRYRDKWYWYSSVCQDLHQDFDLIDKDIEVVAWMPLPKPYKGGDDE